MAAPALNAAEDRALSPLTGWTREHWVEVTGRMLAGVLQYADAETGQISLPDDPEEPGLPAALRNPGGEVEAFERTAMVAAAWIAATGRTDVPGYDGDVAAVYRTGLQRFIDPSSPHYVSAARGLHYRCGAGIVLAMLLAPADLLEALPADLKSLLAEHLAEYIHRHSKDSNHLLFSMMPAAVLERLGAEYDRPMLDDYFDRILSMYTGDGWFIDGWNRQFDHYNFWGFQLYLHALVTHDAPWREQYGRRIGEITRLHERTLPFWFGRDGCPVPKGRSINYRFAAVSGIAYAQLSGLASMAPGQARRIASGCLRYFWDRGCLSERGLLEPGYHGANAALGEDYTDRGAPYWAATGLAALALPAEHPFWTEPERPIPADSPGVKRLAVPGAQMVFKVDGDRGEARAVVGGEPFLHRRIWQAGLKFFQHAYSSTLGHPLTGEGGPELAVGRTGLSADGRAWAWRTWPRVRHLDERRIRSEWDAWPALEGLTGTVVCETLILDRGEVHIFGHTSPEPRYLSVGGYGARIPHGAQAQMTVIDGGLAVESEAAWSAMRFLVGVKGRFTMEEIRPREGFRHAHLFGGWSACPRWVSEGAVGCDAAVVVWVDAGRRAEAPQVETPEVVIGLDGRRVTVEADGQQWDLEL